jgi:hypothetical protein
MSSRNLTLTLLAALAGVGALALFQSDHAAALAAAAPATPAADLVAATSEPSAELSPSGNVHIGAAVTPTSAELTAPDEAAAITWTTPAAWKTATNPSAMRLATYKVPAEKPDTEEGDVSVVRAGGTADANIARWREQFEGAVKETRTTRTVAGLAVTVVELQGTYRGGSGASTTSRPGWSLVAAIVETRRLPYFFKLTGGTATVHSARASFEALLDSIADAAAPD